MKHLHELVLPLLLVVEQELPRLSGLRLDESRHPPCETDREQNARDPMLLQLPLDSLQELSELPPSLQGVASRARQAGSRHVEAADVICAVCASVVEDALARNALHLDNVRRCYCCFLQFLCDEGPGREWAWMPSSGSRCLCCNLKPRRFHALQSLNRASLIVHA